MRVLIPAFTLLALGACTQLRQAEEAVAGFDLLAQSDRAISAAYRDQPFEDGAVSVIAEEHGEMRTYSLTPCRGGTHICGANGRQGHMTVMADYVAVSDAYPVRTFYLRPGGDGAMRWRGAWHPLAWD